MIVGFAVLSVVLNTLWLILGAVLEGGGFLQEAAYSDDGFNFGFYRLSWFVLIVGFFGYILLGGQASRLFSDKNHSGDLTKADPKPRAVEPDRTTTPRERAASHYQSIGQIDLAAWYRGELRSLSKLEVLTVSQLGGMYERRGILMSMDEIQQLLRVVHPHEIGEETKAVTAVVMTPPVLYDRRFPSFDSTNDAYLGKAVFGVNLIDAGNWRELLRMYDRYAEEDGIDIGHVLRLIISVEVGVERGKDRVLPNTADAIQVLLHVHEETEWDEAAGNVAFGDEVVEALDFEIVGVPKYSPPLPAE